MRIKIQSIIEKKIKNEKYIVSLNTHKMINVNSFKRENYGFGG